MILPYYSFAKLQKNDHYTKLIQIFFCKLPKFVYFLTSFLDGESMFKNARQSIFIGLTSHSQTIEHCTPKLSSTLSLTIEHSHSNYQALYTQTIEHYTFWISNIIRTKIDWFTHKYSSKNFGQAFEIKVGSKNTFSNKIENLPLLFC